MELPLVTPEDGNEDNAEVPSIRPSQGYSDVALSTPVSPKKLSLMWLWILLGVILALILAVYIGFALYFKNHFVFNTTVNGVSVSFQTADEANAYQANKIANYSLSLEAREDLRVVITGSEIGLRYINDGSIDKALAEQQPWAWPLSLVLKNPITIKKVWVVFDQQRLTVALATFTFMNKEQMRKPVDACLAFENHAYVISPGDEGTALDVDKTTQIITTAIYAGETSLDLRELGVYEEQEVTADDPTLEVDRNRFNQYVPFQITYILGDMREVLNGYTTINWVNAEGHLSYDAVRAYVKDFAERYDTLQGRRTIINGFGEEKQVEGGIFGWWLNQDDEFWAILYDAEQHAGVEREPNWITRGVSFGDNDWGKTYLEVDMTEQYMWYFIDGVCVLETDVITGNPNTGYATPQGVYYIFLQQRNIVARGDLLPDGTYEWETPVSYWMQFTYTGCGFHDAYWQPSFGGSYYLWRGSHGCINMPPYLAAELYSMVQVGVPVITHH